MPASIALQLFGSLQWSGKPSRLLIERGGIHSFFLCHFLARQSFSLSWKSLNAPARRLQHSLLLLTRHSGRIDSVPPLRRSWSSLPLAPGRSHASLVLIIKVLFHHPASLNPSRHCPGFCSSLFSSFHHSQAHHASFYCGFHSFFASYFRRRGAQT